MGSSVIAYLMFPSRKKNTNLFHFSFLNKRFASDTVQIFETKISIYRLGGMKEHILGRFHFHAHIKVDSPIPSTASAFWRDLEHFQGRHKHLILFLPQGEVTFVPQKWFILPKATRWLPGVLLVGAKMECTSVMFSNTSLHAYTTCLAFLQKI